MTYSIVRYDQETATVVKGFDSEDAALSWAEKNCEPDPRWFLLTTPEDKPIVNFENIRKENQ
jgi:hypothetical protein